MDSADSARTVDLAHTSLRDLNRALHAAEPGDNRTLWHVLNARGQHALAVGVQQPIAVRITGNVGYYCAGMNEAASITVDGSAGPGVAENIMSGTVRVRGDASQYAGASGRGGLLVIEGNAASRCGISMKGVDIVVGGNVGHMSAFMAQAGALVVLGDAGASLGDSIYEADLYVRGSVASLGADCVEKALDDAHRERLGRLLAAAGYEDARADDFRRYGSARTLYHFDVQNVDAY